jgi:hypothetical protein
MGCDHVKDSDKPLAKSLLWEISLEFAQVEERTNRLINQGEVNDSIDPDKRCISPSDYGFHNAIYTNTGVKFFDFEFAGWDDPAKATLDFDFQPRVPIAIYGSPLLSAWNPEHQYSIEERCKHLRPILKLKWLCIRLAVLNPARLEQMLSIVTGVETDNFISMRLEKARYYLDHSKIQ